MKQLLLLLLVIAGNANAQWQTKTLPVLSANNLNEIFFINDSTAYVAADENIIYCTHNFSQNFRDTMMVDLSGFPVPYECDKITDLYYTNLNNGFMTGTYGFVNDYAILSTNNGGNFWNFNYYNNSGNIIRYLTRFDFNGTKALACGAHGLILKSNDSGQSWGPVSSGVSGALKDIVYTTSSQAICIGESALLRSTTSGSTWVKDPLYDSIDFVQIEQLNANDIYLASGREIHYSQNGGFSFTDKRTPFTNILSICAVFPDTLYAGTLNGLYVSYDKGSSWSSITSLGNKQVNKIAIRNNIIYVLSNNGKLYTSNISTLVAEPVAYFSLDYDYQCGITNISTYNTSVSNASMQWYLNDTLYSVNYNCSLSINLTQVVKLKLVVTNSNGTDSLIKNITTSVRNQTIADAGPDHYNCFGQPELLIAKYYPGQTYLWSPYASLYTPFGAYDYTNDSALTRNINGSMEFYLKVNNSDNCPAYDTVAVIQNSDIEETFHQIPLTIHGKSIMDLAIVSRSKGYALSSSNEFMTTNDGGKTWSFKDLDTIFPGLPSYENQEVSMQFLNKDTGFIGGLALKTINGGQTFTQLSPKGYDGKVSFCDPLTGIFSIQGNNGGTNVTIHKTINGGQNFSMIYNYTVNGSMWIYDMKMLNPSIIYLCGYSASNGLNAVFKKSSDGGSTWTSISVPGNRGIISMSAISEDTIYLLSFVGIIYKTFDGGLNWTTSYLRTPVTTTASDEIEMIDAQHGYVASSSRLFKTENGGDCWQEVFSAPEFPSSQTLALSPEKNEIWTDGYYSFAEDTPAVFISRFYHSLDVSIDSSWCTGNTIFTHNYSTGYTQFTWKLDNNFYSNARDTFFVFNQAGNHQVKLIADSAGIFIDSITYAITLQPHIGSIGTLSGPTSFCVNSILNDDLPVFTVSGSTSDVIGYYWSTPPEFSLIEIKDDHDSVVNPSIYSLLFPENEKFPISVYGVNDIGCRTDTLSIITVGRNSLPPAPASYTFDKDSFVLVHSSYYTGLAVDTIHFLVSSPPANSDVDAYCFAIVNNQPVITTDSNVASIPYFAYCAYNYVLSVGYSNGCGVSNDTVHPVIFLKYLPLGIDDTPDTLISIADTVVLRAHVVLDSGIEANCTTLPSKWYRNGVNFITNRNFITINGFNPSDTGQYKVYTYNKEDTIIHNFHVGIERRFKVSIDSSWCLNNEFFTHNQCSGYNTYKWYLDNSLYVTDFNTSFIFSQPGNHNIKLVADSALIRSDSVTFQVTVLPSYTASIGAITGKTQVCTGYNTTPTNYLVTGHPSVIQYHWYVSKPLNITSGLDDTDNSIDVAYSIQSPNDSVSFFVYGTNTIGCRTDTASLLVRTTRFRVVISGTITPSPKLLILDPLHYGNSIPQDSITVTASQLPQNGEYYSWTNTNTSDTIITDINSSKIPASGLCPQITSNVKLALGNVCGILNTVTINTTYSVSYPFDSISHTPDTVAMAGSGFTIRVNAYPNPVFTSHCNGPIYSWYKNGSFVIQNFKFITITNFSSSDTGMYDCRLIWGKDTTHQYIHVQLYTTVGINAIHAVDFDCYPNPVLENLFINSPLPDVNYTLSNTLSETIARGILQKGLNKVNTSELSQGVYIINIQDNNDILFRKKIFKE